MSALDELARAEAVVVVTHLLEKLEAEADHAASNAEEWSQWATAAAVNNQTRIWQQEADEKNTQATALRVILGLPPRVKRDDGD